MIARNITRDDLINTLHLLNVKYEDNITFKREPEPVNTKGTAYRFTLTVKSSKGKGGRRGAPMSWNDYKQRRVAAACWHVHGDYFDTLFELKPEAIVKAGQKEITANYGNWEDWNIGSRVEPFYFSEACDC